MAYERTVTFGDFLVWLLLSVVTFGIYTAWWWFSRVETSYRVSKSAVD